MKLYIPEKYRNYFEGGQMYVVPSICYSLMLYNYKDCKKLFRFFKNLYETEKTDRNKVFWMHTKAVTMKINYNQEEKITLPQLISSKIFQDGWPQNNSFHPKFEKNNLGLFVYWEEYLKNKGNK